MCLTFGTGTEYKTTLSEVQEQDMPPRQRGSNSRGRGRGLPRPSPTIISLGRHTITLMDADRARINQANEARAAAELYEDAMFGEHPTETDRNVPPPSLLQRLSSPRPVNEPSAGRTTPPPIPIPVQFEPVTYERRGGSTIPLDPAIIREMFPFTERGAFSLEHSLGHQLAGSRSVRPSGEDLTCRLYARGGQETMFYDPGELSSLRNHPETGSNHFTLELVNQARGPRQWLPPGSDAFTIGQVVWLVQHNHDPQRWSLVTEDGGPYTIVASHFNRYVLIDRNGRVFPVPVHSSHLLPYTSTWSAVRIPEALRNHPEVLRVGNGNVTTHPNFLRYN
jgi:hypothetical protein